MIESLGTPVVVLANETYENTQFFGAQDNGLSNCRRAVIDRRYFSRAHAFGFESNYYGPTAGNNYRGTINYFKEAYQLPAISPKLLNRQTGTDNYQNSANFWRAGESVLDQTVWALTGELNAEEKNPHAIQPGEMGDISYLQNPQGLISATGADEDAVIQNFNKMAMDLKFGDGLPLVIPTRELVDEMMSTVDRKPDEVLGKMYMRGGVITVETVAANAVMAGCKPEYFPVLLAAAEALGTGWEEDRIYWHLMTTGSTGTNGVLLLVSGPIAEEIGMEMDLGYDGAGNTVNNTIGRAFRLLFRNISHNLTPDIDTNSRIGRPNDHVLPVAAENLAALPAGWMSHSEMMGFPAGSNTVTLIGVGSNTRVMGANNASNSFVTAVSTLANLLPNSCSVMSGQPASKWPYPTIVTYSPEHARMLAENGYPTKNSLREARKNSVSLTTYPNGYHIPLEEYAVYPVVAGTDPGGSYVWNSSAYNSGTYQTHLISKKGEESLPGTPQNIEVDVNQAARTATLSWAPPARTGGGNIIKYQVSFLDGRDMLHYKWFDVPGGGAARSFTFGVTPDADIYSNPSQDPSPKLEPGVQYFFRVRAVSDLIDAKYFLNRRGDIHITGVGNAISQTIFPAPAARIDGHGAWGCYPSFVAIPHTAGEHKLHWDLPKVAQWDPAKMVPIMDPYYYDFYVANGRTDPK
ncbi:MAG: fibronectin type III domain-containing protein [Oscillospiraceae bacterium]|nr:fibronectin type III domain-containing protein [Oscillospiraceae bacterium]